MFLYFWRKTPCFTKETFFDERHLVWQKTALLTKNTFFDEKHLFWRNTPFFDDKHLFWRKTPFSDERHLFWRKTPFLTKETFLTKNTFFDERHQLEKSSWKITSNLSTHETLFYIFVTQMTLFLTWIFFNMEIFNIEVLANDLPFDCNLISGNKVTMDGIEELGCFVEQKSAFLWAIKSPIKSRLSKISIFDKIVKNLWLIQFRFSPKITIFHKKTDFSFRVRAQNETP